MGVAQKRMLALAVIGIMSATVFTISYVPSPVLVSVKSQKNITTPSPKPITLLLGGDVMLGRTVTSESLDQVHDPMYPFLSVESALLNSDIVFVNLETPVVEHCPRTDDGLIFCAPPEMLSGLTINKKTIVNLSNNHTLNYGNEGYIETKNNLKKDSIGFTDNDTLLVQNIEGKTFGFLGFDKSQQSNPELTDHEEALVKEANAKVDILVIAMHWGIEYQAHPTDGQRTLAKHLVDLGADVIVGHHSHWIQDTEKIGNVPVYYSLGNFVFDQMWSEETRKGLLVRLSFSGKNIVNEEKIPIYLESRGQPIILP